MALIYTYIHSHIQLYICLICIHTCILTRMYVRVCVCCWLNKVTKVQLLPFLDFFSHTQVQSSRKTLVTKVNEWPTTTANTTTYTRKNGLVKKAEKIQTVENKLCIYSSLEPDWVYIYICACAHTYIHVYTLLNCLYSATVGQKMSQLERFYEKKYTYGTKAKIKFFEIQLALTSQIHDRIPNPIPNSSGAVLEQFRTNHGTIRIVLNYILC